MYILNVINEIAYEIHHDIAYFQWYLITMYVMYHFIWDFLWKTSRNVVWTPWGIYWVVRFVRFQIKPIKKSWQVYLKWVESLYSRGWASPIFNHGSNEFLLNTWIEIKSSDNVMQGFQQVNFVNLSHIRVQNLISILPLALGWYT